MYFVQCGLEIKFFQSPDTHGFATAVGYFSKNFAYEALVNDYLKATGLSVPIFVGQQTPLLPSTWNIPETQLRYAADMIFCVGRIGFPLYVALLSSIVNIQYLFPISMLFFGILGCFSSAYLSLSIFKKSFKLVTAQDVASNAKIDAKLILIISLSFWLTIFVLEGTLNQLWLLVACQFHILQLICFNLDKDEGGPFKILYLSAAPLFLSVIYPHGLLLLFIVSAPFLFYLFFDQKRLLTLKIKDVAVAGIATLFVLPLSLFLLHGSFDVIIKNVLSGISGAPYILNHSTLLEYLPGFPYMFLPTASKTYRHFFDSSILMYLSWIILFGLSLAGAFILWKKKTVPHRLIILILSLPIILLATVFLAMTKHPFHPYIFSRYCAQFVTLGLPFLSVIFLLITKEKEKFFLSKGISLILTIVLSVSILNFLVFTHKFNKYSNNFTIIKNSEITKKLDLHNSILVTDKPDHRMLSLALYGPIYNLTSDWAVPYFRSSPLIGRRLKVYKVEILNNNATFNLIGHLNINKDLTGPITANEILKNPNFEKIK
jgi:hypothetical protein